MDPKALSDIKPDQLIAAMQILAQQNPQYIAALQAAQAAATTAAGQTQSAVTSSKHSTQLASSSSSVPSAATTSTSAAVLPQYSVPAPPHGGSKYNHLLLIIEEINKDIRPAYSGNRNCAERLKRGINHARVLVKETLLELDKQSRTNATGGSSM